MAVTRTPIPAWMQAPKADERLELNLAEMKLDVRTVKCFEDHGTLNTP